MLDIRDPHRHGARPVRRPAHPRRRGDGRFSAPAPVAAATTPVAAATTPVAAAPASPVAARPRARVAARGPLTLRATSRGSMVIVWPH